MGAPNDLGKAVKIGSFRPRAVGSVGKWQKGCLVLNRKDVAHITGQKVHKIKMPYEKDEKTTNKRKRS